MKKITPVLLLFALLSFACGANNPNEGFDGNKAFCGSSTEGSCESDSDCITGGCSGQICQSKNEEPVISTCEWRDCYDAQKFSVQCLCIENKCRWE